MKRSIFYNFNHKLEELKCLVKVANVPAVEAAVLLTFPAKNVADFLSLKKVGCFGMF